MEDKVLKIHLFATGFLFFFYYYLHFHPPITRKRRSAIRARLGVLSTALGWGNPVKCLSQRHNKQTCQIAPHCPFNAERQAGKL